MKFWRKRLTWFFLALFLLPALASSIWYSRQVRQQCLDHALIEAIKRNDTQAAIVLLNQEADANAVDKPETPRTFQSLLVDFWNKIKGDKPPKDREYFTPALLLMTHRLNNPILVKSLLEHGANPYIPYKERIIYPDQVSFFDGKTILHIACMNHFSKTVQVLLEHHVNPNVRDRYGDTPLMDVDYDCARLLIHYGADVNAHGADGNTPLMGANEPTTIQLLLDHKADVNARSNDGTTPLMRMNKPRTIQLLLDHKADVNAQDSEGRTSLDWAVLMNDYESIRFLLQRGAKVSIKDKSGETALDIAIYRKENGLWIKTLFPPSRWLL